MPVARQLPLAPDPVAIARRLGGGDEGLALLHSAEAEGSQRWSFIATGADRVSRALDPSIDDDPVEAGPWGHVPRWIGIIPYEDRRSALERAAWTRPETRPEPRLARTEWHRYRAVVSVDHLEGRVFATGMTGPDLDRLVRRLEAPVRIVAPSLRLVVEDAEPVVRHTERIAAAQELIRRGDLYQVNLARALRVRLDGIDAGGALELYERLVRRAPTPYGALLRLDDAWVLSTSPELLLRLLESDAGTSACARALTAPIKGTRPRGDDARSDRAFALELDQDPKERAELAMIVDVERNDLGRVAVPGTVRLASPPTVVTHRTVHHRAALLSASIRAGVDRPAVLAAMLPSGSVTGAPKVRAMEVIAGLEERRRGLYTGGIGFLSHAGELTLSMAIRTVVVGDDGEGEYLTGGGIVADSDPSRELEETRWKAVQLQLALSETM